MRTTMAIFDQLQGRRSAEFHRNKKLYMLEIARHVSVPALLFFVSSSTSIAGENLQSPERDNDQQPGNIRPDDLS